MKPLRPAGDVGQLPTVTFGQRSLMWWATVGFMFVEGWTLALCVAAYLYVRQNFTTWPPLRTPVPDLVIPTVNLALLVISIWPAYMAQQASKKLDERGVKLWLTIGGVASLPILVLRWFELWALNVRWDTNAYGSAAWVTVGLHSTLLLLDVGDTVGFALFYWIRDTMPVKAMSDVSDNSFYWYFMVATWIPLYLLVYVGPRVL
jgi:heme/copper-type cytochrome/quinol oxidase subunit 3